MKKFYSILCSIIFIIASSGAYATSKDESQKAITEAKTAHKKADKLQGAWVTTEKLIKKAEKAVVKGDYKKAIDLAAKAKREAELAQAQALHEQKNWSPPPYLK